MLSTSSNAAAAALGHQHEILRADVGTVPRRFAMVGGTTVTTASTGEA
ncbi:hypothetical protein ACWEQC_22170 [Streptomyces shenzhenensis]